MKRLLMYDKIWKKKEKHRQTSRSIWLQISNIVSGITVPFPMFYKLYIFLLFYFRKRKIKRTNCEIKCEIRKIETRNVPRNSTPQKRKCVPYRIKHGIR